MFYMSGSRFLFSYVFPVDPDPFIGKTIFFLLYYSITFVTNPKTVYLCMSISRLCSTYLFVYPIASATLFNYQFCLEKFITDMFYK